jgi:hypothetical protein
MTKILITNDVKKKAKIEKDKLKGKNATKLSKAEADAFMVIIGQMLGIVDTNNLIK